ncbi:MFS transporter [Pseudochelatococcus contaminans]|uniref:MFS family permease n=1 Tax=Pseudochelatococcus contaminans TaxID=1538103 RepID=A0A7W5Z501_9HYPH|nr:MFS transporter [Pseudochelatococcus contaminans]MBB3810280.1 MFS family permease [Pseudochelatococcus contaminans]
MTIRTWFGDNRFLIVFALLASLMGTSVGVAKLTTALYAIELKADAFQFGVLVAGQMFGTLFMSLPTGFLVDHFGPWRLFVAGSTLAGATYALVPLVAHPAFLLGCTVAISFFMPLRFVSLNTVFFEQIRKMGSGKAAWYRATHMSGQFLIGPSLAVTLIALLGYAGTWWVLAFSFAVTIAVSPIVLRNTGRLRSAVPERLPLRTFPGQLLQLLRDRELRWICAVDIFIESLMVFEVMFVVAIAIQVFGMHASGASAFVTAAGLSFIAALFWSDGIIVRIGIRNSYLLGFSVAMIGLLLQGSAATSAGFWPGILLLGVSLGLLQTVTLMRVVHIGARFGQGKVSGVILMTPPLGAILGGTVGAVAGQYASLQAAFYAFAPFCLALFVWQWYDKLAPTAEPEPIATAD